MLIYNWFFILVSFPKLIEATTFDHIKRISAMLLILLAVSGTIFDKTNRMGFFVEYTLRCIGLDCHTIYAKREEEKNELPRGV